MKTYEVSWESSSGGGSMTFYRLLEAKRFMKLHPGSKGYIYKTWSNGDFECVGVITLSGSNKTFVANTRQRVANY